MGEYSECDEIAENKKPPQFNSFDECLAWVKADLGEYGSYTINSNVAEALWNKQRNS
jgi:hypothetical protein